ncbi:MAG: DHH family phosphoesterase [Paramuribaculum sp.]|nr:DHH family phosphoesterase [Paramuribaculum sp.]
MTASESTSLIPTASIEKARMLIEGARSVALVCHMTPDGDALGSMLCLQKVLMTRGKRARGVVPDMPPASLQFLPGVNSLMVASSNEGYAAKFLSTVDLVICLDFNDAKRIDRLAGGLLSSPAKRIVIDHHLNPVLKADVLISFPEKSSTSALVFHFLEGLGWLDDMDVDSATCCCAGMMTDTGNFSYNSNDPDLYRILSVLVAKGVDKDALYRKLFNTNSESRIRIMGFGQYARMELFPDHGAALITLSRDELNELHYRPGDTEGLVNVPLSIPGIHYSIFLRQNEPDYVKVSMRSVGDFSVKELCEKYFGGGGHMNAAGGEYRKSLDATRSRVRAIIESTPLITPKK